MKILNSVVVSTMVSETKIFTCYEFPEWLRVFFILWALLPSVVISVVRVGQSVQSDWIAGLSCIYEVILSVSFLPSLAVG